MQNPNLQKIGVDISRLTYKDNRYFLDEKALFEALKSFYSNGEDKRITLRAKDIANRYLEFLDDGKNNIKKTYMLTNPDQEVIRNLRNFISELSKIGFLGYDENIVVNRRQYILPKKDDIDIVEQEFYDFEESLHEHASGIYVGLNYIFEDIDTNLVENFLNELMAESKRNYRGKVRKTVVISELKKKYIEELKEQKTISEDEITKDIKDVVDQAFNILLYRSQQIPHPIYIKMIGNGSLRVTKKQYAALKEVQYYALLDRFNKSPEYKAEFSEGIISGLDNIFKEYTDSTEIHFVIEFLDTLANDRDNNNLGRIEKTKIINELKDRYTEQLKTRRKDQTVITQNLSLFNEVLNEAFILLASESIYPPMIENSPYWHIFTPQYEILEEISKHAKTLKEKHSISCA